MENWSPEQVDAALKAGEIILVDVREPGEYENERIPGALLLPLSTFDPAALPTGQGRKVVLHCAAGGALARHCRRAPPRVRMSRRIWRAAWAPGRPPVWAIIGSNRQPARWCCKPDPFRR